mmetsp:Transcript_55543/g.172106  ORF Transcript_55543/g.172106 Transcript_55543/m.172106 type:complete len:301 (+) Transcript_55543:1-903(+)
MFVNFPRELEAGLAAACLAAPPPGLPRRLPCSAGAVCCPPPGLERPLPSIGDLLLTLSQGNGEAALKLAAPTPVLLQEEVTLKLAAPTPVLLQEALLRPASEDVAVTDQLRSKCGKQAAGSSSHSRWWSRPEAPLLCALTGFPISLLPYPPFKLRVDPKRSSPHRLVDGKFLAIHFVATGSLLACGRSLEASDLSALDDYVHRCKLGPYRPGRAAALLERVAAASTMAERRQAEEGVKRFVAAANTELSKLRRIQENRLIQLSKAKPADKPAGQKSQKGRPCASGRGSTASTAASSTIDF